MATKIFGAEAAEPDFGPTVPSPLTSGVASALDALDGIPGHQPRAKLHNALDLEPSRRPNWLARSRIPRPGISILVGDEGIGKSTFWVYIVAAVTTGHALPEFGIPARDAQNVILVLTEDDWSTTVRPRLELAEADLTRVKVHCVEKDGSGIPTYPTDLYDIQTHTEPFALVVVDSWVDTLPSGIDIAKATKAREVLHPWKDLSTNKDCAVLLVTHTNRVSTGRARDKYGMTSEIRKVARATLYAQKDEETGYLIVGPEKLNQANTVPATAYKLESVRVFEPSEDSDGTVPILRYVEQTDRTASQHITDKFTANDEAMSEAAKCKAWLRQFLENGNGSAESKSVLKVGGMEGFTNKQIRNAREGMRPPIAIKRQPDGSTVWLLGG